MYMVLLLIVAMTDVLMRCELSVAVTCLMVEMLSECSCQRNAIK